MTDDKNEAHRRICERVRQLLDQRITSQRELADLLGCDASSVNRALKLDHSRRREWRAWEVYAIAVTYGIPIQQFFRE